VRSIFLLTLIIGSLAVNAQGIFVGQFKSLLNGEPILYAKVSTSGGVSQLTNIEGMIRIPYHKDEKIIVSHLTYDTLEINPYYFRNNDTAVFYLKPRVYQLKEVKYSILGPRATFDHRFVTAKMEKSDAEKIQEKLQILGLRNELIALDKGAQGGVVLGSPITALYDRYSKKGKERRKYNELVERDRLYAEAGKKFDKVIVRTLTNYTDQELQDFIKFCSFHPTYIDQVSALQLYYEILYCRDEYEKLK
jgi:hypothetical protein